MASICSASCTSHFWCSSSGRTLKGSSICTAMSSIDEKMNPMNSIANTSTGWGLSSHHVPVPNSANLFTSANGSRESQIQRNRTEYRVYPSGMGVRSIISHLPREEATSLNWDSRRVDSWKSIDGRRRLIPRDMADIPAVGVMGALMQCDTSLVMRRPLPLVVSVAADPNANRRMISCFAGLIFFPRRWSLMIQPCRCTHAFARSYAAARSSGAKREAAVKVRISLITDLNRLVISQEYSDPRLNRSNALSLRNTRSRASIGAVSSKGVSGNSNSGRPYAPSRTEL
mmetsp:Transcript_28454/g.60271  ORF Transcript_28454/g.60271 Transcript_28454/m.60271 type:complete len:286 (-) Transcript_28454:130-987(-)